MARSTNGRYMTKVKGDGRGNPTVTIWTKKRSTRSGKVSYGGTWVTAEGKRFWISFMPANVQKVTDRSGKETSSIPVSITLLPDMDNYADRMSM